MKLAVLITVALLLAVACTDQSVRPADSPRAAPTPAPTASVPGLYVVQQGDYLSTIADAFDVPVEQLIALNDLDDPSRIEVGQEIVLPDGASLPSTTSDADADTATRSLVESFEELLAEALAGLSPATIDGTAQASAAEVARGLPSAPDSSPASDAPVPGERAQPAIVGALPLIDTSAEAAVVGVVLVTLAALIVHELAWLLYYARRAAVRHAPGAWGWVRRRRAALAGARRHLTTEHLRRLVRGVSRSRKGLTRAAARPWHAMSRRASRAQLRVTEIFRVHRPVSSAPARRRTGAEARLEQSAIRVSEVAARAAAALRLPFVRPPRARASGSALRVHLQPDAAGELERAIELGQLRVEYRPVLDATDERVVSVEALLLWEHPKRGRMHAEQFMAVADRSGLSGDLFRIVLSTARAFVQRCRAGPYPSLRLTVGVTRAQFFDPSLTEIIESALRGTRLPPHCLEIEVSERIVLADPEAAATVLSGIRELGVSITIDDFERAASVPDELTRLGISAAKVDFWGSTQSPRAPSYVTRAVTAAQSLGLPVTAKRVETPDEVELFRSLGCTYVQGDAFAVPLTGEAFLQRASRAA